MDKTKQLMRMSLLCGLFFLSAKQVEACDFYFKIDSAKEIYAAGDELVITVTLELTHRNCRVGLDETQFKGDGVEITGATRWIEISPSVFARKFKVKISAGARNPSFSASRECRKDGGSGHINFKTV